MPNENGALPDLPDNPWLAALIVVAWAIVALAPKFGGQWFAKRHQQPPELPKPKPPDPQSDPPPPTSLAPPPVQPTADEDLVARMVASLERRLERAEKETREAARTATARYDALAKQHWALQRANAKVEARVRVLEDENDRLRGEITRLQQRIIGGAS